MIIPGKPISKRIMNQVASEVAELGFVPAVALVRASDHPAIDSYIRIKQRVARRVGVELVQVVCSPASATEDIVQEISMLERSERPDGTRRYQGIVAQLPMGSDIDTEAVLGAIPRGLDIDVLSPEAIQHQHIDGVLPPVVGAVRAYLQSLHVPLHEARVAVIGQGALVGQPVLRWLEAIGAQARVVTRASGSLSEALGWAEVVVSGVGRPGIITPELVHRRHIIIDAGTAESGGQVLGDVDVGCYDICRAVSPVPGGVGPIAVAVLFQNLVTRIQSSNDDLASLE